MNLTISSTASWPFILFLAGFHVFFFLFVAVHWLAVALYVIRILGIKQDSSMGPKPHPQPSS